MTSIVAYKDFVDYRARLHLALQDAKAEKKSAASNRLRAVKKHLEVMGQNRAALNCEALSRVNLLEKLAQEVEAVLHPPK